jgi:ABC-2 type transport system ATP-binding protein
LEEADVLADRIAIINHGKIAIEGTPQALKARVGGEAINVTFADTATVERAQAEIAVITDRVQIDRHTLRLYLAHAAEAVPSVVSCLEARGLRPQSLTLSQPTLDDVFLQVTGERYDNEVAA